MANGWLSRPSSDTLSRSATKDPTTRVARGMTSPVTRSPVPGINDLRQDDLRHGFAIRRLRGGANLAATPGLLRHTSTKERLPSRWARRQGLDLLSALKERHQRFDLGMSKRRDPVSLAGESSEEMVARRRFFVAPSRGCQAFLGAVLVGLAVQINQKAALGRRPSGHAASGRVEAPIEPGDLHPTRPPDLTTSLSIRRWWAITHGNFGGVTFTPVGGRT